MRAGGWAPKELSFVYETMRTSTAPSHVLLDGGTPYATGAFIKTLGNPMGPTALFCEYVGTALAAWLGLETAATAIFDMPAEPTLSYHDGCASLPGPAFAARELAGKVWDGRSAELSQLERPDAVAGLVIFDTWTRNRDRYSKRGAEIRENYRNVFLARNGKKSRLVALDQSECFDRGNSDWVRRLHGVDQQKDETIFGLFPGFKDHVTPARVVPYVERLGSFKPRDILSILDEVPSAWIEKSDTKAALTEFCAERARFLHAHVEALLEGACMWDPTLWFPRGGTT